MADTASISACRMILICDASAASALMSMAPAERPQARPQRALQRRLGAQFFNVIDQCADVVATRGAAQGLLQFLVHLARSHSGGRGSCGGGPGAGGLGAVP